jgi:hypothetical protein
VQYELDALDPEVLRAMYQGAIDDFWNPEAHRIALDREAEERAWMWKENR